MAPYCLAQWQIDGHKEVHMDWDRLEGDWKQLRGKVRERWGKLTDDDLTAISGRRDQLEGKIQERYGYAKSQARREIEDWYRSTESHLADEIETIRTEIQNLTSTVGRIANKQIGRAQVRATEAAHEAEAAITRNPFTAMAIAVGVGFLFGMFTRR
jgi:uncharacterized protein YjbJ (UPF0337 family)